MVNSARLVCSTLRLGVALLGVGCSNSLHTPARVDAGDATGEGGAGGAGASGADAAEAADVNSSAGQIGGALASGGPDAGTVVARFDASTVLTQSDAGQSDAAVDESGLAWCGGCDVEWDTTVCSDSNPVHWQCITSFPSPSLVLGHCRDRGTALPRYCCPQNFAPQCKLDS